MATNFVPATILMQMGGIPVLRTMIGAHSYVGGADFVQFAFKGCKKFNKCRVVLNSDDTYTLGFYRYKKLLAKSIEYEVRGLHFNQLIIEFKRATGLYLTI